MSMSRAWRPRCSSQIATTTAAATMSMNAGFQNARVTAMAASSTTADPTAAGRSRPARPWSFCAGDGAGGPAVSVMCPALCSDLEKLGFLVLEQVVDRVRVELGHRVETLLRPSDVVLARL